MRLPLLISVPHGGTRIPPEVKHYCRLTPDEIRADGDEGAREIYELRDSVAEFVSTDIARAILDVNRAENDRRADGIVKERTIWKVPVYNAFPLEEIIQTMIQKYYMPFHEKLTACAQSDVLLGIDCHTMAAQAPPIEADYGKERPAICLSDADGTISKAWIKELVLSFEESFRCEVSVNNPFKGGYIIRTHASELPWVQLELSRGNFMSIHEKKECVLNALHTWCNRI